ncbi:MAG: hypothetical protein NUV67_02865 [archaeon]|nr:hypothetical protein [archaeon]
MKKEKIYLILILLIPGLAFIAGFLNIVSHFLTGTVPIIFTDPSAGTNGVMLPCINNINCMTPTESLQISWWLTIGGLVLILVINQINKRFEKEHAPIKTVDELINEK